MLWMITNRLRHLKSDFALFQTSATILFDSIEFVKYWRHFLGLNTKGPNLFLCVCVAFAYSIKKAWETRKFHVANVQKNVMQVKSYCFANLNLLLFCRSRCRRRRRFLSPFLLWSRKFVTMVTWGHTFLYSFLTQECKQENWCCRLRCLGV